MSKVEIALLDKDGNEIKGENYSRVDISGMVVSYTKSTHYNAEEIIFPEPQSDWGNVSFMQIIKGNYNIMAELNLPPIRSGDTVIIKMGDLTFSDEIHNELFGNAIKTDDPRPESPTETAERKRKSAQETLDAYRRGEYVDWEARAAEL